MGDRTQQRLQPHRSKRRRADRAGFWSAGHSAETPAGISAGQDLNEFGWPRISAAGQLRRPALYTTVGTERHAGFEAYRDVASLRRRLHALCEDAIQR